jgi:hypothetical protein
VLAATAVTAGTASVAAARVLGGADFQLTENANTVCKERLELDEGEQNQMNIKLLGGCAAILVLAGVAGSEPSAASIIYNNPYDNSGIGDCSWSTTCAAEVGRGDDYAAQQFTLTSAANINIGSFVSLDSGGDPTAANWGFYTDNGGLPGILLASGSSAVTGSYAGTSFGYNVFDGQFSVGSVTLGAGTYFFALQGVSSVFETYLAEGVVSSGAAETHDGGATWSAGYESIPSVAVDLASSVPEPSTWAMMALGFAGLGLVARRASRKGSAIPA